MDIIAVIANNQPFAAGLLAWFIAQLCKLILALKSGINRKTFKRFWASGGFPSSHSSAVTALATVCGLKFGFDSAYFAISAIFALIVIYDAFTLRQEAGKHAEILNRIIEDFYQHKTIGINHLKELLGHTRFEVFFGFLLGIVVAFLIVG